MAAEIIPVEPDPDNAGVGIPFLEFFTVFPDTENGETMEKNVSEAIISDFTKDLRNSLESDVIVAGAGPSGLIAARILSENGLKVSVFEKKLAPGGGMWGGAMMFNSIVIEEDCAEEASRFGIQLKHNEFGSFTARAVQATSALISGACNAGTSVFNCMAVEDVVVKEESRISGAVINWSPVMKLSMMVDPLTVVSSAVLDATGHPADVVSRFSKKNGISLEVPGERSLDAPRGEADTVNLTRQVYPGLFVCGMCACAAGGGHRMGPVFGGMILSGMKAAEMIEKSLKN